MIANLGNLKADKIHALTSLRFFAALFVVFYHSLWSFMPWVEIRSDFGRLIALGYISVSFFFLLSGYILGIVYLRSGSPVRVWPFFKARFARVYPLFLVTLILDTPILFTSRLSNYGMKSAVIKTAITFLGNSVMLQAWIPRLRGIDNPNWSLSVETLFYLTFPFIGVLLWKLKGSRLWLSAGAIYFGGQLVVALATRYFGSDNLKFYPYLHLSTFALGILLARLQTLSQQRRDLSGQPVGWAPWIATALAIAAFAAIVRYSPESPTPLLGDGMLAPIFAAVIWAFSHSRWLPARMLSPAWLVVLGEASFGLYLFHIPVFNVFELLGWTHTPALFPLYLGLSIGISLASFYWFETPARKWLLKRGRAHVKETMEAASSAQ